MNQLVDAREADADLGFMARTMALCSLPRTNPGNQLRYVRRNGPHKLGMSAASPAGTREEVERVGELVAKLLAGERE